jgi:hypothetical protein
MDADTFNASGNHGSLELWTSVFIGISTTKAISLKKPSEGDLEANYGASSQILPYRRRKSWWSRFIRFLVHIWPKSIAKLFLPYLASVFLERIFQLSSDQKSTEAAVLQALRTYLFFRVLEKCLDVLQKSLWNRVIQSCRRRLAGTALHRFLTQDEEWNQRHSASEKSSAVGKSRAVDKFTTEAIFGILPTIVDLVLAVWLAANRFFLLCSGIRTAHLEKKRSDAERVGGAPPHRLLRFLNPI